MTSKIHLKLLCVKYIYIYILQSYNISVYPKQKLSLKIFHPGQWRSDRGASGATASGRRGSGGGTYMKMQYKKNLVVKWFKHISSQSKSWDID